MKKCAIYIGLLSSTLGVSANELQASYPIHDSVTLSDGTVVDMPFHVEGSLTTALLSVINTKWARQLINHSGFEPIEIKCNGINSYQGIGVLYFQDITRSPAGRYAETVNTIAVKRKSAPDLNLPCLEKNATKREKMQYLLGAMQILATANAVNQANNTPHDYAMFNQHLELNSQRAITAGVEIWGYPKSFANINHWMSDHYLSVQVSDEPSYKPILQFYYKRKVGTNTPLKAIGDNVLPERLSPSLQTKSQLSGVLSSDSGWVQPFIGHFWVGDSDSETSMALKKTEFSPVAVLEYTNVKGVALPLYKK